MKFALIGYGRMGKAIEEEALKRGHDICAILRREDLPFTSAVFGNADAIIEFSHPGSAADNILAGIHAGIPVISGTTGWLDRFEEVCEKTLNLQGAFLHASNFSIGVNVTMAVNRYLGRIMNRLDAYNIALHEVHHIHKLDAPSGTAITLAEDLVKLLHNKHSWTCAPVAGEDQLLITSQREGEVPGTHVITWKSDIDAITLKHEAHNRRGFAQGAVIAAEWITGKKGIFTMRDVLNMNE